MTHCSECNVPNGFTGYRDLRGDLWSAEQVEHMSMDDTIHHFGTVHVWTKKRKIVLTRMNGLPICQHCYTHMHPFFNAVLAKRNPDQVGSERGMLMFNFAEGVAINAMVGG